ncbi:immunoglobulin mu Fc receptor isoform X1 [Castor canadensis]|uniref:immunoglobulin mu Fc receptor isoform X1 n=1 Tax=Castor canadensis TaxID=51338 RepID=UPI003D17D11F
MNLWLWSLYFLPLSGALRILPEVQLDGELGGSVIIECPLSDVHMRMYLCREMATSGICATVVSNSFVKDEYRNRVSLKPCSDKNLFLVEITELTESDSGVYACGLGKFTDRGKTQKVTLNVHNEYEPFWEEEPIPEPPKLFHKFLHLQVPTWFQTVAQTNSEIISKVTTPTQKIEGLTVHHSAPTTPVTHHPQVSTASSVAAVKPPTLLPSTTASKTSAQEGMLRPQGASYNHQTRLHRERAFNHGSQSERPDQGFHILIPTTLGLFLLALLGLVAKRAIQRRKASSRRVRRLAVRMSNLEASHQPQSQRPRASHRPRSQSNVYSACPRRARMPDPTGQRAAPLPDPPAAARPAPQQISESPWFHDQYLKTSCEYVTLCHQPAAKMEDTDSNDYINIPSLTHLPSCPRGPRPWCQ